VKEAGNATHAAEKRLRTCRIIRNYLKWHKFVNLHWWTEYGLIGTVETLKFMEQVYCHLSARALLHDRSSKENSYDISAAQQSFDITKLQPQLYVTCLPI
jgi:hypothetical protein